MNDADTIRIDHKGRERMHDAMQIVDVLCAAIAEIPGSGAVSSVRRDQLTKVIVEALANAESRAIEP